MSRSKLALFALFANLSLAFSYHVMSGKNAEDREPKQFYNPFAAGVVRRDILQGSNVPRVNTNFCC